MSATIDDLVASSRQLLVLFAVWQSVSILASSLKPPSLLDWLLASLWTIMGSSNDDSNDWLVVDSDGALGSVSEEEAMLRIFGPLDAEPDLEDLLDAEIEVKDSAGAPPNTHYPAHSWWLVSGKAESEAKFFPPNCWFPWQWQCFFVQPWFWFWESPPWFVYFRHYKDTEVSQQWGHKWQHQWVGRRSRWLLAGHGKWGLDHDLLWQWHVTEWGNQASG